MTSPRRFTNPWIRISDRRRHDGLGRPVGGPLRFPIYRSNTTICQTSAKRPGAGAGLIGNTLLFTDLVDSSAFVERLGDVAVASLWAEHGRSGRALLVANRGREIGRREANVLAPRPASPRALEGLCEMDSARRPRTQSSGDQMPPSCCNGTAGRNRISQWNRGSVRRSANSQR